MGCASSIRRPTWETIFSMMCSRWALSLKRTGVSARRAVALDVDLVEAVDQDVGDGRFLEERLQRPQAEDLIEHLLDDPVLLGRGHGHALVHQQALDDAADLGTHAVLGNRRDAFQVQHADQLAMNLALQLEDSVVGPRCTLNWRSKVSSQAVSFGTIL